MFIELHVADTGQPRVLNLDQVEWIERGPNGTTAIATNGQVACIYSEPYEAITVHVGLTVGVTIVPLPGGTAGK